MIDRRTESIIEKLKNQTAKRARDTMGQVEQSLETDYEYTESKKIDGFGISSKGIIPIDRSYISSSAQFAQTTKNTRAAKKQRQRDFTKSVSPNRNIELITHSIQSASHQRNKNLLYIQSMVGKNQNKNFEDLGVQAASETDEDN